MTSIRILVPAAAMLAGGLAQSATSPQDPERVSISVLSTQALLADAALLSALHSLGLLEPGFAPDANLADLALIAEANPALWVSGPDESIDAFSVNDNTPVYWAVQMSIQPVASVDPEWDLLKTGSGWGMHRDGNTDDFFVPRAVQTGLPGKLLSRTNITMNSSADPWVADIDDSIQTSVYPPVSAIPEPGTSALMVAGLGWLGSVLAMRRRLVR